MPVDAPAPEPEAPAPTPEAEGTYAYRFTGTEPVVLTSPHRGEIHPGEEVVAAEPIHHARFEPANDAAKQAQREREIAELAHAVSAAESEGMPAPAEVERPARRTSSSRKGA